ncbi:hypothetical protein NIES2135_21320 [Leptolyngbya boryana NIES-2135]|jgi:hypothetical protein|uniref:Uncharacterized protein n=1 Tax=Leptolyngbya boryana NIES-2135 TaxID=1973484 RepID=A0A1Z4JEX2_LEPBY|nr:MULTISPECIES: hypothetical protein [Leptolyngbya]BAY55309.1 hypothetical protein NIES2135_21320 [Leptolyngbya boryana NIES-2135]MBD2369391.1 hypothetical protein [Leptolyngbya sp. FACHB-161]MBD2375607.1 hypothetical protein [Leptolyngbya sp. FACHB-238]MBD2401720.1 hypothetical protein [Leptolyngbya sp. FACHB-239]MBD2406541.1 hypothetical protein [Leptolyngbya sp. FACHB-402]
MVKYASIVIRMVSNPLTGESYIDRYVWDGEPHLPVQLDFWARADIKNMPWTLEIIKQDYMRLNAIAVRTDIVVPWYAYYRFERDVLAIVDAIKNLLRRLILVAMVFGFADVPMAEIPSWRHLGRKQKWRDAR